MALYRAALMQRRTKIVATIGPASRDPEVLARMVEAGMDVARLNFSHGSADEHAETARRVREAAGRAGRQVAILQDLPGPKLRIGKLREGVVEFKPGDATTFVCGPNGGEGDASRLFITYAGLASTVERDEIMYLADGAVRLRINDVRPESGEIDAVVEIGGAVASRQGLNIPGETAALPAVPDEDLEHVRTGERIGVDIVALSFVRRAEEIVELRKHTRLPLVAKIEKPQAVTRAEEIVRAADCVMVARGDLGIELPIEEVPIVQKQIICARGRAGPAGDHRHPDAGLDGRLLAADARRGHRRGQRDPRRHRRGDALPGERGRAVPGRVGGDAGDDRQAHRADRALPGVERAPRAARPSRPGLHARLHGDARGARAQPRRARLPDAFSGRSARLISAHRPTVPILALSPGRETVRRCGLMWGVQAASMRRYEVTEELIAASARRVVELGWLKPGDRVGITAGLPSGKPGTTSLLQIQEV